MGKGTRGGQEKEVSRTKKELAPATYGGAAKAQEIYYGSPTSAPTQRTADRATSRDRRLPTQPQQQSNLPPGTMSSTTGGQDYQSTFEEMFPDQSLSSENLISREGELNKAGMKLLRNAEGVAHKIQLPDGTIIDVVQGATTGVNRKQWQPATGPGGVELGSGGGDGKGGPGVQGPGEGGVAQMSINNYLDLMNRYGEFAETGGYDSQTLDAIRSRALSPSRAVYSDVNRGIDRSRSLQGDYAPGYAATRAKTAREQSMALSDATTNVEGGIGQMVQQGRLSGLRGMSSLYGTTPGLANMFGNQALQSRSLSNQLGMGLLGARQDAQQLPGAWDTTMGRIGQIGGAIFPWANR